jgi:anti-sigma B factor antagonist
MDTCSIICHCDNGRMGARSMPFLYAPTHEWFGLHAEFREPQSRAREVRTKMLNRADTSNRSQPSSTLLGITQRQLDQRTSVIAIRGELDLARAPSLKWTLIDSLAAGHDQLVLDLSLVSFMDSTALGVLVGVNRSLDVGARLAIVGARANVLKIFEISGLDGAFAIFSTLDAALAYAQGHAARAS